MSNFDLESIIASIKAEFFIVDGDYRISQRGLARLIGCSKTAIAGYCQRFRLATLEVEKPLETALGANRRLATIGSKDASDCIRFYAIESVDISIGVKQQAIKLMAAFAYRGYIGWVADLLDVKADYRQTDSLISSLISRYPGAAALIQDLGNDPTSRSLTISYWLRLFKGLNAEATLHATKRLAAKASGSYQMLTGDDPETLTVSLHDPDIKVNLKLYSLNDIGILENLYEKYLKDCEADKYRHSLSRLIYSGMACNI